MDVKAEAHREMGNPSLSYISPFPMAPPGVYTPPISGYFYYYGY
jgi:hypothetical protein